MRPWRLAAALALVACSETSSEPADEPPGAEPCGPDDIVVGDSCLPPGVPAEACAAGFEWVDAACRAILPDGCPPGTMASLGETACVEVGAGCGDGPWGDIPVEGTTVYVDAAAAATGANGSAAQPFVTIGEAVAAAAPGAIVAIAEGSYDETVHLNSHPVRLWGRCPQRVAIASSVDPAVIVQAGGGGSEIRNLALTAAGDPAVRILSAAGVLVRDSWVHDMGQWGIEVVAGSSDGSATVERTLVERVTHAGILALGGAVVVRDSEVREILPHTTGQGFGIAGFPDSGTGRRANLELDHVVVRDIRESGLNLIGADVVMRGSVVQRVDTSSDPNWGLCVSIQLSVDFWDRANVVIEQSEIAHCKSVGVLVIGADVAITTTSIHDITLSDTGILGRGVEVEEHADGELAERANITLSDSTIRQTYDSGVMVFGSQATLERMLIQDVVPNLEVERGGTGAWAQPGFVNDQIRSEMTVRQSLVERTRHAGVGAFFSDLAVDQCVVRDTLANPNGTYGDAIIIAGGALSVSETSATRAARVGVASFGGQGALAQSDLLCNAIDLLAQDYQGYPANVQDMGGNRCGCDDAYEECRASAAEVTPPAAL